MLKPSLMDSHLLAKTSDTINLGTLLYFVSLYFQANFRQFALKAYLKSRFMPIKHDYFLR